MPLTGMLSVMREVRNFFEYTAEIGEFEIVNSIITLTDDYLLGQYILITGSILNDGLYLLHDDLYTLDVVIDEKFTGIVYGLRVPRDFVDLSNEIIEFNKKAGINSDLVSESFGTYSYRVATTSDGMRAGWIDVFADRLREFRHMFTTINV